MVLPWYSMSWVQHQEMKLEETIPLRPKLVEKRYHGIAGKG